MHASREGYGDVVRVLLEQGADVDAEANAGDTAESIASQHGHAEVVEMLRAVRQQQP
jgi:ankyrin repeat protein